jgi:hypothetical protein
MTNNAIISSLDFPAEVIFSIGNVGIKEDNKETSNFIIYPNPAFSSFQIKTDDKFQSNTITIYNIYGQLVMQKQFVNQDDIIYIEHLHEGIYIVSVSSENSRIAICKLIKL